ncbi:hypothetical protein RI367_003870 [Sorochytrium milnesiophthora]
MDEDLNRRLEVLKGSAKDAQIPTDDELTERFHRLMGRSTLLTSSAAASSHNKTGVELPDYDWAVDDNDQDLLKDITSVYDDLQHFHTSVAKLSASPHYESDEVAKLITQVSELVQLADGDDSNDGSATEDMPTNWRERLDKLKEYRPAVVPQQSGRGDLGPPPKALEPQDMEDETDKWCCICNEDGAYVCTGCDDDVYCRRCWKEGHEDEDDEELRAHKKRPLTRAR